MVKFTLLSHCSILFSAALLVACGERGKRRAALPAATQIAAKSV